MADLHWEVLFAYVENEQHLLDLPAEWIALDDAQEIFMRMRVFGDAGRNGSFERNLPRYLASKAQSANISSEILDWEVAMLRARQRVTFKQSPIYELMQSLPWTAALGRFILHKWDQFANYMLVDFDEHISDAKVTKLIAGGFILYGYLGTQGLVYPEVHLLSSTVTDLHKDIVDLIAKGGITTMEAIGLQPLLQILSTALVVVFSEDSHTDEWNDAVEKGYYEAVEDDSEGTIEGDVEDA